MRGKNDLFQTLSQLDDRGETRWHQPVLELRSRVAPISSFDETSAVHSLSIVSIEVTSIWIGLNR